MNKTELLAAFSDYLEAQETKPETHEAYDQQTDMYSLFVEMSTLKNEVKTQARQFKTAMDDFREVFHSLKEQQSYLEHELNKKTKQTQQLKQKISRSFLLDLISLRDRILLSIHSIKNYPSGAKHSFKKSVLEGQIITLKRIDQQLKKHRVTLIATKNKSINPRLMKVVALASRPELKNGIILKEIRAGFIIHFNDKKQLLRPAEVKVNKLEA